jgi:hypothetical protein
MAGSSRELTFTFVSKAARRSASTSSAVNQNWATPQKYTSRATSHASRRFMQPAS